MAHNRHWMILINELMAVQDILSHGRLFQSEGYKNVTFQGILKYPCRNKLSDEWKRIVSLEIDSSM